MKKSFGIGSSRVYVRSDGKIEDSTGRVYGDHDEALAQAYDMEREQLLLLAKNFRDAVHYSRDNPPEVRLDVLFLEDEDTDVVDLATFRKNNSADGSLWNNRAARTSKSDLILKHLAKKGDIDIC